MRSRTVAAVAVAVVLALVVPGLSQPFADVPTNHWAYDAIAELAAKGLIEGYPDGTFKGNQPLTRYEMAMVVARIIARIEAIPTPPPPEVRRADLDAVRRDIAALRGDLTRATGRITVTERDIATLRRLVSEFRAELQALGVRVTALEEELSALRARLDNTRVGGLFDSYYVVPSVGTPVEALPAPFTGERFFVNYSAPYTFGAPALGARIRLTYTGSVAPGVSVFLRARNTSAFKSAKDVDFDRAYLTVDGFLGIEGLRVRIGRDTVTLGPIGLLLDGGNGNVHLTGAYATWRIAPLTLFGFAQWVEGDMTSPATVAGGRVSFDILPGWTLGASVRSDMRLGAPAGVGAGQYQDGIGWSVDLSGTLVAGLKLTGEWAHYRNDTTTQEADYWMVRADVNLTELAGIEAFAPRLSLWYKNFGPYVMPAKGIRGNLRSPDFYPIFFITPSLRAFGARLDLQLTEDFAVYGVGEWGDFNIAGTPSWNLWEGGVVWTIAPRVSLTVHATTVLVGGTTLDTIYGAYLSTSW